MTKHVEYDWHIRELMAQHGLHLTTKLRPALAERGVVLSESQVYRLVTDKPERMNLPTLFALLDIFQCSLEELMSPRIESEQRFEVAVGDEGHGLASVAIRERGLRPPSVRIISEDGGA